MPSVFISHSSKDKDAAMRIFKAFEENDIVTWIDNNAIGVGDTIDLEIERGIKECDFLLFLISPDAVQSNWARGELARIGNMGSSKKVLPAVVRDTPLDSIPTVLQGLKYADLNSDFDAGVAELLLAIKKHGVNSLLDGTLSEDIKAEDSADGHDLGWSDYYHPVIQKASGRRLYFVLVKSTLELDGTISKIKGVLENGASANGVSLECQCSYMTLGEWDFLIKVWANWDSITYLRERLCEVADLSHGDIDLILAYHEDTWYQRKIEAGWDEVGVPSSLMTAIAHGGYEEHSSLAKFRGTFSNGESGVRKSNGKFWIITTHDSWVPIQKLKTFFGEIRYISDSILSHVISHVSVYPFYWEDGRHGVVIKGESSSPVESAYELIRRIHGRFKRVDDESALSGFSTSSMICVDKIFSEVNATSSIVSQYRKLDREGARGRATQNFLLSHKTFRIRSFARIYAKRFRQCAGPKLEDIFRFSGSDAWDDSVHRLRRVFIWIVRGENVTTKAFLLEDYFEAERILRVLLEEYEKEFFDGTSSYKGLLSRLNSSLRKEGLGEGKYIDKTLEVVGSVLSSRKGSEFGLGTAVQCFKKMASGCDAPDREFLRKCAEIVDKLSGHRNSLAHGNVIDIYESADDGRFLWVPMLENYIDYLFIVRCSYDRIGSIANSSCSSKVG